MKNIIGLLILSLIVNTQAGKKMIIHSSGSNTEYIVAMVDSITFEELDSVLGKMKLIYAKDSSFIMGSEAGDEDEKPVHIVNFTYDFWMDSTEVTQKEYKDLMSDPTYGYENFIVPPWHDSVGLGDNYPAYNLGWNNAMLYCNARSKAADRDTVYQYITVHGSSGMITGYKILKINYDANGFRLPTEAEWEYAARGGSSTDFYWGKDFNPYPITIADSSEVDEYAIWHRNSYSHGSSSINYGTQEVATKAPNRFGLYDMIGNVWECCNDKNGDYSVGTIIDPIGPEYGSNYIIRGGSWKSESNELISGYRNNTYPTHRNSEIGFRVVCRK